MAQGEGPAVLALGPAPGPVAAAGGAVVAEKAVGGAVDLRPAHGGALEDVEHAADRVGRDEGAGAGAEGGRAAGGAERLHVLRQKGRAGGVAVAAVRCGPACQRFHDRPVERGIETVKTYHERAVARDIERAAEQPVEGRMPVQRLVLGVGMRAQRVPQRRGRYVGVAGQAPSQDAHHADGRTLAPKLARQQTPTFGVHRIGEGRCLAEWLPFPLRAGRGLAKT